MPKDTSLASEYYVIPLYEDGRDYDSWDLFNMHHHIMAGLVQRANIGDLSSRQTEEAHMIAAFIRDNMNKNGA